MFEAYHSKIQKNLRGNEVKISSIKDSDVIVVHEVLSEKEVKGRVERSGSYRDLVLLRCRHIAHSVRDLVV